MKTLLVYRDAEVRERFLYLCQGMEEFEIVGMCSNPEEAMEFAKNNLIELAIVEMEKPYDIDFDLGISLKLLHQGVVLIYITTEREAVGRALKVRADYCLMKTFDRADVLDLAERAKLLSYRQKKARAVMFGRFQFFSGNEVVCFTNSKARELLALCLDHHGGEVQMEEAIDKLWPDRIYDERVKKLYRKAVMNLQSTLRMADAEEIFVTRRGICYVIPDQIDCDYFTYLDNPAGNRQLFQGEYLFDYEWGEETLARLLLSEKNNFPQTHFL